MSDYVLRRRHSPGKHTWTLRATRSKLVRAAEQNANLIVECGREDSTVRFVIPVGPDSAFARDIFPRLAMDARGSCTFDVSPTYTFTWRDRVRFDGTPYLAGEEPIAAGGQP